MNKFIATVVAVGTTTMLTPVMTHGQERQSEEYTGIETVIVSVQKHAEDLQKVPISVTALGASDLARQQITDVTDLSLAVPGFALQPSGGKKNPFIRGLGIESSGPWQEAGVSTYIDGVYYTDSNISNMILNNLERVEVIKGPQGTLFGRNSIAGAISYVTRTPTHKPTVEAEIGYGNYQTVTGSVYASTGLTENLVADIALASMDQGKGWGRNLLTGEEIKKGYRWSARSKWVYTPSDRTSFTFVGDWGKWTSPQAGNGPARGVFPFVTNGPPQYGGFYDGYFATEPYNLNDVYGGSLKFEHSFDWARVVSLSAGRYDTNTANSPHNFFAPFLPATPAVGQINNTRISNDTKIYNRNYTQEFQLLSPESSKITWVAGAFLMFNDAGNADKNDVRVIAPVGQRNTKAYSSQKTDSYSFFAQATAPIFNATRLTGGFRYIVDHRRVHGFAVRNSVDNQEVYTRVPGSSETDNPAPSASWSKPTFKVALDHDFTDSVMGYASFSTGFQSAYYSIGNGASDRPINPTNIRAYEVGVKSSLFNNTVRLNSSAFFYDVEDVVVSQLLGIGLGVTTMNAAKAEVRGVDLDVTVAPVENLTINAAFEYLDAPYTDYKNASSYVPNAAGFWDTVPFDATGMQLANTERFRASGNVHYRVPTINGDLSINGALSYSSGMKYDTQGLFVHPSYALANASVDWTSPGTQWVVTVWARNMLDKKYASLAPGTQQANYNAAEPRTFGVTVRYSL